MAQEETDVPVGAEQVGPDVAEDAGAAAMDTEQAERDVVADDSGEVDGDQEGNRDERGEEDADTRAEEEDEVGGGDDKEDEREDEDAVLAQRDKLRKIESRIAQAEPADMEDVAAILDALMSKWDNIEVPQIVLGGEQSLGMIVRRLRKHEDEELATRASRLYDMYRSEVQSDYDARMEKRRKQMAKEKEKSERKKALSSMSKEKKKSSEKTSERKQKREKKKAEGAEKKNEKKRKKKRKASSDEDNQSEGMSEPEPELEEADEGASQESPKKKHKKEKKPKEETKKKKKKKKSKRGGSDDDDDDMREASPEPEVSDVPGRIIFLLRKMIQTADLTTLTSRGCKAHIRESFEDGDAVLQEHKQLIKDTIDVEVHKRG